ncbi:hypothetical protein RIVM261_028940 [Rivularia sp. IAM M-261]|nr:hypothetical protein CAL7716_011880 [Calothrix sp. PCC 7716]GJD17938.1 hypothetical protein RIVM261_028940 [Rivularia sp. IAM M-261]
MVGSAHPTIMKIQRFADARQFYERVKDYLLQQEAMHNLNLGYCNRLVQSPDHYQEQNYLAIAESKSEVIGVVIRTPPFGLLLSVMSTIDANIMALIVADVHDFYKSLPGVNAPINESKAFAQAWCDYTGNKYKLKLATRVFQLEKVQQQNSTPGDLRLATVKEKELLKRWYEEFCQEALDEINVPSDTWVERQLSQNNAYLWYNQAPVSMACRTRSTPNGIAVSMVYTPPEYRRQGYASNCVAALSQELLNQGYKYCFLFADLANSTSNHIYQEIGYQPIGDWQEYSFVE